MVRGSAAPRPPTLPLRRRSTTPEPRGACAALGVEIVRPDRKADRSRLLTPFLTVANDLCIGLSI
jgi:hypothetical protein